MSSSLQQAIVSTLDCLIKLCEDEVRPAEARDRVRLLQSQQSDVAMQLVWEEEAYDKSLHYDVLIRLPERATVSLSYCPDRALPWPLRGVHRWAEVDLLRVNDTVLKVEQAIACLDFLWDEAPLINRLINICLIQEEFDKNPVEVTDPELQLGMDGFRRAHKLYSAEETHRWLQMRGMTHAQLEHLVADNLAIVKLRDRIAEGHVAAYFEEHRSHFDVALIAQIECTNVDAASQILRMIASNEMGFYESAERYFVAAAGPAEPLVRPLFAKVRRDELSGSLSAMVFSASIDDVVGPARTDRGYTIARVLSLWSAQLDESIQSAIKSILFEEWLTKRREAAAISWSWGNSHRTR